MHKDTRSSISYDRSRGKEWWHSTSI